MPAAKPDRADHIRANGRTKYFCCVLVLLLVQVEVSWVGSTIAAPKPQSVDLERENQSLKADLARIKADQKNNTGQVTFIQLTDPHLFDAGRRQHAEGVLEVAIDNRAAFHWAILETNTLAQLYPIRFVVVTGDFGLENVQLPHTQ